MKELIVESSGPNKVFALAIAVFCGLGMFSWCRDSYWALVVGAACAAVYDFNGRRNNGGDLEAFLSPWSGASFQWIPVWVLGSIAAGFGLLCVLDVL